jgi:hypothetical protein
MVEEEFRVVPGYKEFSVSNDGIVKLSEDNSIVTLYSTGGYWTFSLPSNYSGSTLSVHRAVALAWVANPNPSEFNIVNHLDANPANNWWGNLEWTTYSGNNYHAINNGLRPDNIPCKVRDFITGEVYEYSSMAQAAEAMGLRKDTSIYQLYPKMFGKLIVNRYEFRFANDFTPWFYESRKYQIRPARYMVIVTDVEENTREIFSNATLLKEYQLYDSPGKSIPALAEHGNQIYPHLKFSVRDSYAEERFRVMRQTKESRSMPIKAKSGERTIDFGSLTQCANYFKVDRSSITNRLNNDKNLDGWTFTQSASLASNG